MRARLRGGARAAAQGDVDGALSPALPRGAGTPRRPLGASLRRGRRAEGRPLAGAPRVVTQHATRETGTHVCAACVCYALHRVCTLYPGRSGAEHRAGAHRPGGPRMLGLAHEHERSLDKLDGSGVRCAILWRGSTCDVRSATASHVTRAPIIAHLGPPRRRGPSSRELLGDRAPAQPQAHRPHPNATAPRSQPSAHKTSRLTRASGACVDALSLSP